MGSGYDIRSAELGVIARGRICGSILLGLPRQQDIWAALQGVYFPGVGSGQLDVHCWEQRIARAECKASSPWYWQTLKGGAGA